MTNVERGPVADPLKRFPPKKIVVGVDFSEESRVALVEAMRLGRLWKSRLELIHIHEPPPLGGSANGKAAAGGRP